MEKTNLLHDMLEEKMKEDFELVKKLGDAIGYGNMMAIASTLWKDSLTSNGFGDCVSGVFYGVPKAAIKKDWIKAVDNSEKIYDKWFETLK